MSFRPVSGRGFQRTLGDGLVWRCGTINVPVLRTLGMVWCGAAVTVASFLNRAGRQSRFAPAAALRFFVALGKPLAQAASDAQCRHSPGEDRGPRSRLGCAASPAPDVLLRFRRPGWGYSTL